MYKITSIRLFYQLYLDSILTGCSTIMNFRHRLAVDATTHAVNAAEVSLETVTDNKVQPTLLNPLRRKIKQVSADGAYDTKACYALLKQ